MAEKSPLVAHLEYGALRLALGLLRLLPPHWALRATDRLGDLAYLLDRRHREVALANVAKVYGGDPSAPNPRALVRRVFRHFLKVGVEFALLPKLIARRGLEGVVDIHGREHVDAALARGTGVIVFTAHLGNWEVVAAAGEPLGMRLHVVGRQMDNPKIDAFLLRERSRWVRSIIPKDGGLPRIVRALRDGDCVAMLLDQHAGRQGLVVDFLGHPASAFRAPAELAARFGFALLPGFGIRVDDSPKYRLDFEPALLPDTEAPREAEVARLTQAIADVIGKHIRRAPDQWNWLHRRWRAERARPTADATAVAPRTETA
ncbi:MAG: lysophospholipid acyltransferase family protein [Planctomycetes bacterium]|nr:lysophospholipid acyltransferase family protein [Planctomycetota bacterium]MCC7169930.1 lysophospholipid acyltransferase family protein [Planctomycetota bacterium]